LKILHVITRGEIGGAQVVVMNLVKNMPQGFTAVVAAGEEGFSNKNARGTASASDLFRI